MTILSVPFEFSREEFDKRVHIELYEDMEDEIEEILEKAVPLIAPKAIFTRMSANEQPFTDPVVLNYMGKTDQVFPFIATCGVELEKLAKETDDMLADFWFDALKQMAMDRAFNYFRDHIKKNFTIDKLYSLSPGSVGCGEGWVLEDQKELFSLFPKLKEKTGVYLTDSLIMHPNKTVSGMMFKSHKDFVSCQECDNIKCSNRKIIHEGAIF